MNGCLSLELAGYRAAKPKEEYRIARPGGNRQFRPDARGRIGQRGVEYRSRAGHARTQKGGS
jgi:hypothetical protein